MSPIPPTTPQTSQLYGSSASISPKQVMGSDRSDSPQASTSGGKRKRSRAGCYTCRRRKKACDSARPVCGSCTRLGIPCVFPKLYRNAKGELVPSPQPNGRTKRLPRESDSPEEHTSSLPGPSQPAWNTSPTSVTGQQNNWSAQSMPSVGSTVYPLEDADDAATVHTGFPSSGLPMPPAVAAGAAAVHRSGGGEGSLGPGSADGDLSSEALDAFLASLGDTEGGQGWVWPLFTDSSLGLDLGQQGNPDHTGASATTAPTASSQAAYGSNANNNHSNLFLPNKMVTAAAVLEHLPALYDYWVNSWSHVLSVLGPGHNPVVNTMLPVVQRSPLVMCALIAWAATHRANIGHPYEDVARLASDTTELQIDQINIDRDLTEDEKEEYMWTLLILGGLEIVRGDVKGWVTRLPMTRRLLSKTLDSVDFRSSQTWQSLAYNCVYHDVQACVTQTGNPGFPLKMYDRILSMDDLEMDCYMGATRRLYPFLMEIGTLAGDVDEVLKRSESPERNNTLSELLAKQESILVRLRAAPIPSGLFSHPLPIGTDRSLLIVSFETYRLAAEMFMRQAVMHCASSDLSSRLLAARIMCNIRAIMGTPNESQMMLPLFLAGVCTSKEQMRAEILAIFTKFSERVQVRNVFTVVNLLLEVWKRDPEGDRYVDWRKLSEESGVALSFA